MNQRDKADWKFWKRIATILGTHLLGWSYRQTASFHTPEMDIVGRTADKLTEQADEIIRLKALARHAIHTAADVAAMPIDSWAEAKLREIDNA
jgi:hypothetical protein